MLAKQSVPAQIPLTCYSTKDASLYCFGEHFSGPNWFTRLKRNVAILSVLDADGNCPWAAKRGPKHLFKRSISCWMATSSISGLVGFSWFALKGCILQ